MSPENAPSKVKIDDGGSRGPWGPVSPVGPVGPAGPWGPVSLRPRLLPSLPSRQSTSHNAAPIRRQIQACSGATYQWLRFGAATGANARWRDHLQSRPGRGHHKYARVRGETPIAPLSLNP